MRKAWSTLIYSHVLIIDITGTNGATTTLIQKLTSPVNTSLVSERILQALGAFAEAVQTVYSLKTKLVGGFDVASFNNGLGFESPSSVIPIPKTMQFT